MAIEIPDLWGDDVNLGTLSPTMILNAQADIIKRRTSGIIKAELIRRRRSNLTELFFDLYAPAAHRRVRVLSARFLGDSAYPVWVTAIVLRKPMDASIPTAFGLSPGEERRTVLVSNENQFIDCAAQIFQSKFVQQIIQSIIAKSNEVGDQLMHLKDEDFETDSKQMSSGPADESVPPVQPDSAEASDDGFMSQEF
jgi:hypothetical protein